MKIHFGDIADFFQKGGLTGLEELVLQFRRGIKVVLDGAFGVAADEEDFLDAALVISSMTNWMAGISTIGSMALGIVFVSGRKDVPKPATGTTALRTMDDGMMRFLSRL